MAANTAMVKTMEIEKADRSVTVTTSPIEFTAANLSNTAVVSDGTVGQKKPPPIEFDDAIPVTEFDKHVAKFRCQSLYPHSSPFS